MEGSLLRLAHPRLLPIQIVNAGRRKVANRRSLLDCARFSQGAGNTRIVTATVDAGNHSIAAGKVLRIIVITECRAASAIT